MNQASQQEAREPSSIDKLLAEIYDYRDLCEWLSKEQPEVLQAWKMHKHLTELGK